MKQAPAADAARRGVEFLRKSQLASGSFESLFSPARQPFQSAQRHLTTFLPAIMLYALAHVNTPAAMDVRQKLAQWLEKQKSPHGSFNYWPSDEPQRKTTPYPDDLDDTFCALLALNKHNPSLVDQASLAAAVKLLLATESQVGGPYRTWLVPKDAPEAWHDVDLAVNANVAAFLRTVAEPLPNLTSLLEQAITTQTFASPYYPPLSIIYYIARAYDGPHTPDLAAHLLRKKTWQNHPLDLALAISSLIRLGRSNACAAAVDKLLSYQRQNGSWDAGTFYIDRAIQDAPFVGSDALTTALALEAITLYQASQQNPAPKTKVPRTATDDLHAHIAKSIQQDMAALGPTLGRQSVAVLNRVLTGDNGREITLLPSFFNQSLLKPLDESATFLARLGAANAFGWIAYTIYDDFLDNEGKPELLSVANAALRQSVGRFGQALPDNQAFQTYLRESFDAIDDANAWELAHCRMVVTSTSITLGTLPIYPNTLYLANRSIGHTLTPLAVLASQGIDPKNKQAAAVRTALRHYIVARQLNDDLHDWEQDLRAGVITYVVAKILRSLELSTGRHQFSRLLPKMRHQFWHHTLPDVCQTILNHTAKARQTAHASQLLNETNIVTTLAGKIDGIVHHTLVERSKAETFLAAYSKKAPTTPKARTQSSPKKTVKATPTKPASHLKLGI